MGRRECVCRRRECRAAIGFLPRVLITLSLFAGLLDERRPNQNVDTDLGGCITFYCLS